MQLFESGEYEALPDFLDLDAFKAYLKKIWASRHAFYEPSATLKDVEEEEATNGHRQGGQGFFRFDGRWIQARNYVGFIQFKGVTICILPKIFKLYPISLSLVFQHLFFYLSYCQRVRFPFAQAERQPHMQEDWPQQLIAIFAQYTEKILSSQPYLTYQNQAEELPFVRGKLSFPEYVRSNISTGQWQNVHTEHSPFLYDNLFNQIVKYTARKLLPMAAAETSAQLQVLLFLLNEVSDYSCTSQDCDRIALNRLYEAHQQILGMCKIFLADEQAVPTEDFSGSFAFLVPMPQVFEEFVSQFIQTHLPELDVRVQHSTLLGTIQEKQPISIRPDLWFPQKQTVLDIKYKLLQRNEYEQIKSISRDDLYQMLSYAFGMQCEHVHLLYPQTQTSITESFTIHISPPSLPQSVYIHVHQIPVIYPYPEVFSSTSFRYFLTSAFRDKLN